MTTNKADIFRCLGSHVSSRPLLWDLQRSCLALSCLMTTILFYHRGEGPLKITQLGKCWNTERKYFSLSEARWWFKAYFSSFSLTSALWNIKPLNYPIHGCLKLQQNGLLITYLLLHAWSEKCVYVYLKGDYLSYLVIFFFTSEFIPSHYFNSVNIS